MYADNFGKQFGPRSGLTNRRAWSGSKLFDILIVFLKEFFWKINFEKNQQMTKKHEKLPSMQWVKVVWIKEVEDCSILRKKGADLFFFVLSYAKIKFPQNFKMFYIHTLIATF